MAPPRNSRYGRVLTDSSKRRPQGGSKKKVTSVVGKKTSKLSLKRSSMKPKPKPKRTVFLNSSDEASNESDISTDYSTSQASKTSETSDDEQCAGLTMKPLNIGVFPQLIHNYAQFQPPICIVLSSDSDMEDSPNAKEDAEKIEDAVIEDAENAKFPPPICIALSGDSDIEDSPNARSANNAKEEDAEKIEDADNRKDVIEDAGNAKNPEYVEHWFPGVTHMNDHLFVQNQDMEDPQFPGVMGINENSLPGQYEDEEEEGEDEEEVEEEEEEKEADEMGEENEMMEDEIEESDMEEEEEVPPEEEEEQCMNNNRPADNNMAPPLLCRSVRVGSYKIHAKGNNQIMNVFLGMEGISFNAPMVSDVNKMVNVILKPSDITNMLVHFGKCLPILFMFTTTEFAEAVRKSLDMSSPEFPYYDPMSNDEKEKKITFLIDSVNDDQCNFLRHKFLNEKKIKEIDQKTANKILVKSTPSQNQYVKCEVVHKSPLQQHVPLTRENVLALTALQKPAPKCEVVNKVQPQQPTTQAQIVPITRDNVLAITALQNPEYVEHWFPGVTHMNDHLFVQNQDMEDPQFPGVMGINENSLPGQYEDEGEDKEEVEKEEEEKEADEMGEEDEMMEDEIEESDMEEEEEVPPEEEEEQCMNNNRPAVNNMAPPLLCRSVRVGSYKIHAKGNNQIMNVFLGMESISFNAPLVSDVNKMVNVILKPSDITNMLVHFGKCLPILFMFTTTEFAEAVRKSLDMSSPEFPYYDPMSNDEKEKKITFLIDSVNDDQCNFLRHKFLNEKKIKEIDQKTANKILVKSTPSQKPAPKCEVVNKVQPQQPTTQAQIVPITRDNVLAITALQNPEYVEHWFPGVTHMNDHLFVQNQDMEDPQFPGVMGINENSLPGQYEDEEEEGEDWEEVEEENPEYVEHWFPGVTHMNDHLFVQNQDMEDPQFPGVMGINENSLPGQYEDEEEEGEDKEEVEKEEEEKEADEMGEEDEMMEDEIEESDMEEEEEVPPEEEEEQCMNNNRPAVNNMAPPLLCRSVRVGSYKIHAKGNNQIMNVFLGMESISFNAPLVSDVNKMVNVILKPSDITNMLVHFGKCLPILFMFTTTEFAEAVRKSLDMSSPEFPYYDPMSNDEKEKKITFLIDSVNEDQCNFLRHKFLNEKKIKEIDQKTANKILVKSTPSQKPAPKCEVVNKVQPQQPTTQAQIVPITRDNVLAITALQNPEYVEHWFPGVTHMNDHLFVQNQDMEDPQFPGVMGINENSLPGQYEDEEEEGEDWEEVEEENPEYVEHWFPGVTHMNDHLFVQNQDMEDPQFPGVMGINENSLPGQYEDEEEEGEDKEEVEEENPEYVEHWFPGVTHMNDHLFVQNQDMEDPQFPGVMGINENSLPGQYEDEEEEGEDKEEVEEEFQPPICIVLSSDSDMEDSPNAKEDAAEKIEDAVIEDAVIEYAVIEDAVIEDAVIEDAKNAKFQPSICIALSSDSDMEDSPNAKEEDAEKIEDAVIEDAVIEDAVIEDAVIEDAKNAKAVNLIEEPEVILGTAPIDVAAHLTLLGTSLSAIGQRIIESEQQPNASGVHSVLLDSMLCAVGPLLCLTTQIAGLENVPQDVLHRTLDHIAYFMPGL